MANVSSKISYFILRRLSSAASQKVTSPVQPGLAPAATKSAGSMPRSTVAATEGRKKEVFWMRDPETGNWMPENHFNQVDPVDLRIKFLATKTNAA